PLSLILSWVKGLGQLFYLVTSAFLLKMTFSLRGLIRAALEVQRPLVAGDLDRARRLLSWHLVSRDTSRLEEAQVASATIESIAENLTDSLIAPLFFYVFFGLPGAFAYRFLNTADAMLGYRDGYRDNLGKGAARLDDLANYIPARLAALFMVIGAWMARENVHGAWRIMRGHHGRTASPNAGWTMAAMAGALGVTLEKVGCYSLGEGGTCVAAIIGRALRVMVFTFALSVAFFGLLLVII
ncbi:MAG: cobalamin biosynthesis protein CobD, partial [candidate division NC10 bacterium]|nr:cobalamin biosynthesis protein CobD [candidate division NC10 bacterium]